jgi:hypothetical protein
MSTTKKKVVSGFIRPRWPKPKVVKWLEIGAVPAILGLWLPDWSGAYIVEAAGGGTPIPGFAFPPLLVYIGALILLKACWEGIRDMGWHYTGLRISGILAVTLAGVSLPLHFLRNGTSGDLWFAGEILSIGLAAFFATGFFWFTIAKVAEITVETRTQVTKIAVLVFNFLALAAGGATVIAIALDSALWTVLLRATLVLFTIAFGFCRYAVYCYKTQQSIGATFVTNPDEQFWV